MAPALQLLLWVGMVGQMLLGLRLAGKAAEFWSEAFRKDYEREVCGRFQAMEANMRSAVAIWRKMGCAGAEELRVEDEVEAFLEEWREWYQDTELERCKGVRLHRERNPTLDAAYPNWVLRYE